MMKASGRLQAVRFGSHDPAGNALRLPGVEQGGRQAAGSGGGCRSRQSYCVAVSIKIAAPWHFQPSERSTFSDRLLPAVI